MTSDASKTFYFILFPFFFFHSHIGFNGFRDSRPKCVRDIDGRKHRNFYVDRRQRFLAKLTGYFESFHVRPCVTFNEMLFLFFFFFRFLCH